MKGLPKNRWLAPLCYAGVAFFLSAWLLRFSNFIGYDGAYYARVGENFFSGRGLSANPDEPYTRKPSFYPFLIGLANLFFKDPEFSAHFVSMLAFALSVIPLYFLARRIYSENTAHWTALLYVTNGYLHLYANLALPESVFTFLVLTLLYLLHQIIQSPHPSLSSGLFVGIVGGLSFLTRPEGVFFYGAGALALVVLGPKTLKLKGRVVALSLVGFLVFSTPYLWFLYRNTGQAQLGDAVTEILIRRQLDLSHPGEYLEVKKMYQGLTEDKKRIKIDELTEKFNLWDVLTKDNLALIRSLPTSFRGRLMDLNKYLFGGLGFVLIGAGLLAVPWNLQRKKSELLLLLFLSTFLFQLLGEFLPKRYFFYFPILLLWMGQGIEVFRNWTVGSFNLTKRASFYAALGLCLFFATASAGYVWRTLRNFPPPLEYKELGIWMKENIPGIALEKTAATHPSVNFYSGSQILALPYVEKFEDFLTYMTHQKAKYFVVSHDSETSFVTEPYHFLLDETKPPSSVILKRHTVVRGDRKIILYEIQ